MSLTIENSALASYLLLMILLGIIIPLILFIIGMVIYRTNKKRGKLILIITAVYAIISFGVCGGFGF